MRNAVAIENIQAMRSEEGIEDAGLQEEIRGLKVGGIVKLTLMHATQASAGETLSVRITSIRGPAFRGKLAGRPTTAGLSDLRPGSLLAFTAAHIHSIPKGQPAREP